GVAVGLANSQTGVSDLLLTNGVYKGTTVAGTGSAISFGNQTATATYSVLGSNVTTSCTALMSTTASVSLLPLPGSVSVSLQGADVVLNWSGSFTLQAAGTVNGTYTNVVPAVQTGPYTNTSTSSARYFRLKQLCP